MKADIYNEHYFDVRWGYGKPSVKRSLQLLYLRYFKDVEKLFGINLFDGKNKKALDIGCAYGYLMILLKKMGYAVHGVDVSKHAIKKTEETLDSYEALVVHDIQSMLPFTGKFDLITCFEVLEHLKAPEKAIRNCFHALKKHGIMLATTPNKFSPVTWYIREPSHINEKSKHEWEEMFRKFNWSYVKTFYRQNLPLLNLMLKLPIFGHTIVIIGKK